MIERNVDDGGPGFTESRASGFDAEAPNVRSRRIADVLAKCANEVNGVDTGDGAQIGESHAVHVVGMHVIADAVDPCRNPFGDAGPSDRAGEELERGRFEHEVRGIIRVAKGFVAAAS